MERLQPSFYELDICCDCGWKLILPFNPYPYPGVYICPRCKTVMHLSVADLGLESEADGTDSE